MPQAVGEGVRSAVNPLALSAFALNTQGMAALLATAPSEAGGLNQAANALVLSLPNPCGQFERFTVEESPIMEPGLAAKHPDIKTYRGRGMDDPTATIRFDLTPLGFHSSVRSPYGAWYIDPNFLLNDQLYVSYYGRDLVEDSPGLSSSAMPRARSFPWITATTTPPMP